MATDLTRIGQKALKEPKLVFTNLFHRVSRSGILLNALSGTRMRESRLSGERGRSATVIWKLKEKAIEQCVEELMRLRHHDSTGLTGWLSGIARETVKDGMMLVWMVELLRALSPARARAEVRSLVAEALTSRPVDTWGEGAWPLIDILACFNKEDWAIHAILGIWRKRAHCWQGATRYDSEVVKTIETALGRRMSVWEKFCPAIVRLMKGPRVRH